MSKPIVAVVGRPNVGEFTLLNVTAGDTISIVKDTPGVARDRTYADCDWLNMNFTLINTGGIEPDPKDIILSQMREQAEIATSTVDVIIFIMDVRQGLVDPDSKVADLLRKPHKPVVLAVNRADSVVRYGNDVYEFYNLGTGEPVAVSTASRLGIGDLLDEVVKHFDSEQMEEERDERLEIIVVGKLNAGKSPIINKLVGGNRVTVSDIVGTIRDAVDMEVTHEGTLHVFIDTAGLRYKNKTKEELKCYSITRTASAVERVDVVVVVTDATEGVTEQDVKIAGIAHERGKGIIVAIDKQDTIEKMDETIYEYTREIKEILSFIPYAEYPFISAAIGQRLTRFFEMIDVVYQNQNLRMITDVLNEIMIEAVAMQQLPSDKGKRLKIYYMTQVVVKPLIFVIFVNDKELMYFPYTRYLESQIRNTSSFKGISLKFLVRERKGKKRQV